MEVVSGAGGSRTNENKPAGSIRIRVETIDYFLRRYREEIVRRKSKEQEIEARLAELERELQQSLVRDASSGMGSVDSCLSTASAGVRITPKAMIA